VSGGGQGVPASLPEQNTIGLWQNTFVPTLTTIVLTQNTIG
jgi:hypothetical protein